MSDEKLDALTAELENAGRARREIERKRDARALELNAAVRETLSAEFSAQLEAAARVEHAARRAVDQHRAEVASSGLHAPYPLGTKFYEWKSPHRWGKHSPQPTGRKAVLEAVTLETIHPSNLRYSRARPGDFILRLLKKDGTASLQYEEWSSYKRNQWYPEGERPNA